MDLRIELIEERRVHLKGLDRRQAEFKLFEHVDQADLATLAAVYGFGLARNHPYSDGNKRVAFVTMAVFLGLNDLKFTAAEAEVVTTMVALAWGTFDEDDLADWIRRHADMRIEESR